jgi:hypothetical protein
MSKPLEGIPGKAAYEFAVRADRSDNAVRAKGPYAGIRTLCNWRSNAPAWRNALSISGWPANDLSVAPGR